MLKLNASYSKKVPVEGQEYSSQQYHASVELELSDVAQPAELTARIHQTFQLVRDAVEEELHGRKAVRPDESRSVAGNGNNTGNGNGNGRGVGKASNKQIQFLTDLALRNGHTLGSLTELVNGQYGVPGLYDLDRKQASRLIDSLAQKAA